MAKPCESCAFSVSFAIWWLPAHSLRADLNMLLPHSAPKILEFDLQLLTHGPTGFRNSYRPEDCLPFALEVLASQAMRDWDSRLVDRTMTWSRPPHMAIVAQSLTARHMEQRFAVWAIVRVMDQMVKTNQ